MVGPDGQVIVQAPLFTREAKSFGPRRHTVCLQERGSEGKNVNSPTAQNPARRPFLTGD